MIYDECDDEDEVSHEFCWSRSHGVSRGGLQQHYLGVNDVGGGHMCCEEHLLWSCNIPAVYCTTFISGGLFLM